MHVLARDVYSALYVPLPPLLLLSLLLQIWQAGWYIYNQATYSLTGK